MNLYQQESNRLMLARSIAKESLVLLKNENNSLSLFSKTVAFYGQACYKPNLGGMGSGDATREKALLIKQVLKGYEEGKVTREQLMDAATHLLYVVTVI